jgi:hypothetical protein
VNQTDGRSSFPNGRGHPLKASSPDVAHCEHPRLGEFLASIAITEFLKAFSKTPLPIVPSTKPSTRPLRFLPSRTVTKSMSVKRQDDA